MYYIERSVNGLGDCYSCVNSVCFYLSVSCKVVAFWSGDSFVKYTFTLVGNQFSVFGMDHHNGSQFFASLEDLEELLIVLVEVSSLVGHEHLEALNSSAYNFFHFLGDFLIPVSYSTVKGIVTVDFGVGSGSPVVVSSNKSLLIWDDEIAEGCSTSG